MNKLLERMAKKPTYPVGVVSGRFIPQQLEEYSSSSSEDEEDIRNVEDYEQKYVQAEMKRYAEVSRSRKDFADDVSSYGCLSEVDGMEGSVRRHNPMQIYKMYNFNCTTDVRKDLPIDEYKDKILRKIAVNQVLVIEGPTGCGKTTQVPQLILDDLREKGQYCNIVVTQPRKIATINVAKRVCEERGWTLGTVCGYQVGLERKISPDMILTYVTIGVLLQKLISIKNLNQYTHIIIDEVHERNQDLDFLLLIVRKFLFTNSPLTKVILMSATFEANLFAYYFRRSMLDQVIDAPIISIDKKCNFQKTVFYFDSISSSDKPLPKLDINKPEIPQATWETFLFLVKILDKLEHDETTEGQKVKIGSVLVFLPGIYEIEEADKLLHTIKRVPSRAQTDWEVVPLHSSLANDEQAKAFKSQRPGCRKIILSTNIAESSVTVPDSMYVIDFCLTKVLTVDPFTKYSSLKLEWASHVNCDQRAGRVGRTCDGRVYRLVPKSFYMSEMPKQSVPEILRAPLDRVILQAKMLNLHETPSQVLALALNPPNLKSIDSTLLHLKEIGALLKTCRGVTSNADGDLTFLGQVMANLPIDVHLSKLIVLGQLFSCLEETVIIAAGCSIQNVFSTRYQQRLNAYKKLLLWSDQSESDFITLLNLFRVWQRCKRENNLFGAQSEQQWCRLNLVNLKSLREWNLLVAEIKTRLDRLEIKETVGPRKPRFEPHEKSVMLKVAICGALYPNYFLKTPALHDSHERDAVKAVGGRDPLLSVYLTGMDPLQPIQLYVRQLKKMLSDQGENEQEIQIGDMHGSCKVFVECKNAVQTNTTLMIDGQPRLTETPGRIPTRVYELVRKRQLGYEFKLKVMPLQKALDYVEKQHAKKTGNQDMDDQNCFTVTSYNPLPSLDTEYIAIVITEHIDAGHFWAQNCNDSDECSTYLEKIFDILNQQVLHPVVESNVDIKVGSYYAARFEEDGKFYRCKVTAMGGRTNQILFIDYGGIQDVRPEDLYVLPPKPECHVLPLAFECVMYGIRPALQHSAMMVWTREVNERFQNWTEGLKLYAKVYSVVNDIVHLELYRHEFVDGANVKSINQMLLDKGFAERHEESYLSRMNHQQRVAIKQSVNPSTDATLVASSSKTINYDDIDGPDPYISKKNSHEITLKGPFSPLETKLHSCVVSGGNRSVVVDGCSVNCVLLDYDPNCQYSRLVVSGHVGQSADGSVMRLRQTSVMPGIPGFPVMMSLLFCPIMEPKIHRDLTRIAAVLCGLGVNEVTNKSLYPPHDIMLTLDTELTSGEIEKVNKLRYLFNSGIKSLEQISRNISTQDELVIIQKDIKKVLLELVFMKRTIIQPSELAFRGCPWGKDLHTCHKLMPSTDSDAEDIWPLLSFVRLSNETPENRDTAKNLDDMLNMVYRVAEFEPIVCLVCHSESLPTLYDLRMHLITAEHKRLEEEFKNNLIEELSIDSSEYDKA